MSFKVPNQFRIIKGPMGSENSIGNCGAFEIPYNGYVFYAVASDGEGTGWEHVSCSCRFTPSWDQMCYIKSLFWDDEDCVIQFHPPKSEYVNRHPNCLHLWRKVGIAMETPPQYLIG